MGVRHVWRISDDGKLPFQFERKSGRGSDAAVTAEGIVADGETAESFNVMLKSVVQRFNTQ